MPLTTRMDAVVLPIETEDVGPRASFTTRALLALAVLLTPALLAFAQETPFQAVVTQDKVEVRAGASNDFYSVGKLERGARVTVVDIMSGWNVITPPPGVQSYIAKSDVTADGKSGVVKSDKAFVRALGPKGASIVESYRAQPALKKGETVEIVSEQGDFYIIEPPKGAVVFLAPGTVRRTDASAPTPPVATAAPAVAHEAKPATVKPAPHVEPSKPKPAVLAAKPEAGVTEAGAASAIASTSTPGDPAAVDTAKADTSTHDAPATVDMGATTKPAKSSKTKHKTTEPAAASNGTTASGDEKAEKPAEKPQGAVFVQVIKPAAAAPATETTEGAAPASGGLGDSAAVREMEAKLAAAAKQPLEKRPLSELLAGYEKAGTAADLTPTDRRIVAVRIGQIKDNLALQKAAASAEAVRKSASQPITLPPPPPPPKPGVYNPADYDAVGQLLASSVYDGDASPRLFRIADPANQRTIAYVMPGKNVDVHQLIGRIVGVKGDSKYDPALRLRVIAVEKMDLLQVEGAPVEPTK